ATGRVGNKYSFGAAATIADSSPTFCDFVTRHSGPEADNWLPLTTTKISTMGDSNSELYVAIAALLISLVALAASVLQVAQQYFASATGYASCDEKVIGKWSSSTIRILKPYEFRFEVQYQAPVIFLCRLDNKNGPVPDVKIIPLVGSDESRRESCSDIQEDGRNTQKSSQVQKEKSTRVKQKEAIHTADNELASWVTLLAAFQRMEHDSRDWQQKLLEKPLRPPTGEPHNAMLKPEEVEEVEKKHTLVVALQKKTKSWDTMPAGVKKPYATTTWCHMVEMAALLGIYWSEFDRSHDRYRAEGNGYMLTGEKMTDLGIMFTFQVYGKSEFKANRIIPVEEVKDLCFGVVPTIFRRPEAVDMRRLTDDRQDLSMLNLSNRIEISETLGLIGCNTNTVNYFAREDTQNKRVAHLFPIAFEIIGMLGRTLHIDHSVFRCLPNPTMYFWNTKTFSLPKLLDAYLKESNKHGVLSNQDSRVMQAIRRHGRRVQLQMRNAGSNGRSSFMLLDTLHHALDVMDEVLTGKAKEKRPPLPRQGTTYSNQNPALSVKKKPDEQRPTNATEDQNETTRRQKVTDVLRSHIQEVMYGLNEKVNEKDAEAQSPIQFDGNTARFEDIDSAAPEDKQAKLMEVYFQAIRNKVIGTALRSTKRRESLTPMLPLATPSSQKRTAGQTIVETSEDGDEEDAEDEDEDDDVAEEDELWKLPTDDVSHEDIWCTLVFRMICWLMLHDFNKNDRQISKSELRGSRLPIYIA
ncbi:hypothetical protein BN1708_012465, partial [Verticillium longisporum]